MARAATFRAPSSSRRRSRRPSGTACPASSAETVECPYQPSNTAIASPSLSVTIAFFHAERRPARPVERPPVRRRARTTRVRTSVTVTLNSASIAARICGLVAAVSTRKAYSLRAWYAAEDFSVMTGPTIRRCWSGICRPPFPPSLPPPPPPPLPPLPPPRSPPPPPPPHPPLHPQGPSPPPLP